MIADVLADAECAWTSAVEAAKEDFATVRTGRANPQLFAEGPRATTTAAPTPLAQLASINNPEARTLIVTPLRQVGAQGDRAGHPRHPEPRGEPDQRRQHRAGHDAGAHRGAPQGVRQAGPRPRARTRKVHVRGIRRKAKDDLDALKSEVGEDELARAEKELDAPTRAPRRRDRRRAQAQRGRAPRGLRPPMTDASGDRRRSDASPPERRGRGADARDLRTRATPARRCSAGVRSRTCARRAASSRARSRRPGAEFEEANERIKERTGRDLILAILIGLAIGACCWARCCSSSGRSCCSLWPQCCWRSSSSRAPCRRVGAVST